MNFDSRYFERYEKQIILKKIGISGQKKILESKVLIIGIGGLGCPLLTYLAASGVGTLGIADHDKVVLSNLNRQTLFSTSDIGKFKVDQAKKKILKINKKIKIKVFKKRITSVNFESIIKNFDIVCDGTDNYETRFLINDQCKKNKKILISAAINKFDGHLFRFNFKKKTPCFRCFMPEKPSNSNNCQTGGIFSPVAGILGSLQANEVLKEILNFKSTLGSRLIVFDSITSNFRSVKLSFNSGCKNKCSK